MVRYNSMDSLSNIRIIQSKKMNNKRNKGNESWFHLTTFFKKIGHRKEIKYHLIYKFQDHYLVNYHMKNIQ